MKIPPHSHNVRVHEREHDIAVWFDALPTFGGKNCFRSFHSMDIARQFAAGIEIIPAPEKGARIRLTVRAKYAGQDERWTERKTGEEILTQDVTVYHFGKVTKTWRPQLTCFFRRWPPSLAEIPPGTFIAEIPIGTHVEYYDEDEMRVDLRQPGIRVWLAKA